MLRTSAKLTSAFVALLFVQTAFLSGPAAFAQDAGTDDENAPIIPTKPFPSLLALDQRNQVWTLKVSGSNVKVKGDVVVDSPNRGALWIADGAIDVTDGTVNVAGNVSRLGRTSISPLPNIGAGITADPFPEFTVPSPEKLISDEKLFLQTTADGDDTVLPPGIYNGGIFASGNGHITLQPGVFVIANGDFSAIGPTVEGKDVTIVMAGAKAGALSFSLGAKLNASAPNFGKMKGLLVVSRASGTFARGVAFSVAQGRMLGMIYAPTSSVSVQSKGSLQVGKIVAQSVDVTSGTLNVTGVTEDPITPAENPPVVG